MTPAGSTTRVALVGGTGKLGGIIRSVIDAEPGFEVVAVLGSQSDLSELDSADLVVDASTPSVSIDVVRADTAQHIPRGRGRSGGDHEMLLVELADVSALPAPVLFVS